MKKFYLPSSLNIPNQTADQKEVYLKRCAKFENDQIGFDKIVFLGDSITEGGGDWNKYFGTTNIVNRGISGDTTQGILARLEEISFFKPVSLFLLIGINDIFNTDSPNRENVTPQIVANNIINIAESVKKHSPKSRFYIQTILPINNDLYMELHGYFPKHKVHLKDQINQINSSLINKSNQDIFTVLDLHAIFLDKDGLLSRDVTDDGVHLNHVGYKKWSEFIFDYIIPKFD